MSFGTANIFYPEAREDKCTIAILLDVDSVGFVLKANLLTRDLSKKTNCL